MPSKFAGDTYRNLAEVQFRFNRRYDLRAILGSLLNTIVRAPKRPERDIRVAELGCYSGLLKGSSLVKGPRSSVQYAA